MTDAAPKTPVPAGGPVKTPGQTSPAGMGSEPATENRAPASVAGQAAAAAPRPAGPQSRAVAAARGAPRTPLRGAPAPAPVTPRTGAGAPAEAKPGTAVALLERPWVSAWYPTIGDAVAADQQHQLKTAPRPPLTPVTLGPLPPLPPVPPGALRTLTE